MATTADPDITVREFGQLEDHILAQLDLGHRRFRAADLAEAVGLTMPKVEEALCHLAGKHDHVDDIGGGEWIIRQPE